MFYQDLVSLYVDYYPVLACHPALEDEADATRILGRHPRLVKW
jgi:hypothetical protein